MVDDGTPPSDALPPVPGLPPMPPPSMISPSREKHPRCNTTSKAGPMFRYLGGNDKNKYEHVLANATEGKTVAGWRHASMMAKQFKAKLNVAVQERKWTDASQAKEERNSWQKTSDDEKELMEKCQWVVDNAKLKLTYHEKCKEFEKCDYYNSALAAATMWIANIPDDDLAVELVENEVVPQNESNVSPVVEKDAVEESGAEGDEVLGEADEEAEEGAGGDESEDEDGDVDMEEDCIGWQHLNTVAPVSSEIII